MTLPVPRTRAFRSPTRYWQGPGELARVGARLDHLGPEVLVLLTARSAATLAPTLQRGCGRLRLRTVLVESSCTEEQIGAVVRAIDAAPTDLVLAVGGGTIIDTAKAAAHRTDRRVAVVPTVASTDAPTAAAAVIYDDAGAVESIETYPWGPDAVLVDTDVIAAAPPHFLVSGFGDAMATCYEARACAAAGVDVLAGGVVTAAGLAIAQACRSTLLTHAVEAIAYVRDGGAGRPAFEAVVEANTLLSGLGFESGGLAGAHALHNGLKPFAAHDALHGELVAYGLLVHLALLDDQVGLEEVLSFNQAVGLATRASDLAIDVHEADVLERIADRACSSEDSMVNMPVPVAPADVISAIARVESMAGAR